MFNRMKTVVTFAAGAVAGLMLATLAQAEQRRRRRRAGPPYRVEHGDE